MAKGLLRKTGALLRPYVLLRLALLLAVLDAGYIIGIWPQWESFAAGPVQQSAFIRDYQVQQRLQPEWPPLRWQPVPVASISGQMIRAVIVAEDARFFEHDGVDLEALQDAMQHNLAEKRLVYGASTISQQTVKNLFLSPSRNPLRKWHEILLTVGMERNISKERILENYLNVAEFGRGVYGVEAAARFYWNIPAARLSTTQAIELAATLPSPVANNPRSRTAAFKGRVEKIRRYF